MFRRRKKITNLVTIEDISHASPKQLKEYFKDDAKENFMRIKNLDNEAREFLKRKITRYQSHFNISSLLSVLITFVAIAVAILSIDSKADSITLGIKGLSLIYLVALGTVPVLLIKNMLEYMDLEMLINKYELKELKHY